MGRAFLFAYFYSILPVARGVVLLKTSDVEKKIAQNLLQDKKSLT